MNLKTVFATLFSAALLLSCNDDDTASNPPLGSYDNGILVLNEGGFGEVTFISDDLETVQNDIFSAVNEESYDLGLYVQSMFFEGNRAYIISNGSHKITVVDRYTFEYITTIATGMQIPRYGVVHNGKAYVTNTNDYNSDTDDFITVINLADFSVESPISVNNRAERLIATGGKLYVSNSAFGMGDKITVIDIASKTIDDTITVGLAPNSLEEKDGILYVLCGSYTESSKLVRILLADNSIIDETVFPVSMGNASNLDVDGNDAFFSVGPKVYKIALNASTVTDVPLFDTQSSSAYIGYGFAVNDGRVFISEAAEDFTSNGNIYVYSTEGTFIDEIPVGLGPNGFYFN